MRGFLLFFSLHILFMTGFLPAQVKRDEVCPRPKLGAEVGSPADVFSSNGTLKGSLALRNDSDAYKLKRYCYVFEGSEQSPTLRVRPGDEMVLTLKNELTADAPATHVHGPNAKHSCTSTPMSGLVTNLHFHGLSLPPLCHQDETLQTLVSPADPAFEYRTRIPADQPPGLYWYHPHPHGFSEEQVLGGASGALIVEGIEQAVPQVAGLPERVLILRDQRVPGLSESDEDSGPGKDISLNFVPIVSPLNRPAELVVKPGQREFWRVLNASADTYFDLQLKRGPTIQDVGDPQTLELVAMDGVPLPAPSKESHVLLSPGARAEFIVTTPPLGAFGQLVMLKYDTGPDGSATPYRTIANLRARTDAPATVRKMPASSGSQGPFIGLQSLKPARQRKLFFSEDRPDLKDPTKQAQYFITLDGETPRAFQMDFKKPDITARQGTVEDWVIENRAREAHVFHIHQLHFQVLERDGKKVDEQALRDTIDIPFWDGVSAQYPSVKLRMDFRSPQIAGTFVFHCHILEHEDGGMMGSIQVVARPSGSTKASAPQ